jgi:multidrug efflux system membrane fusion protein
MRKKKVGRFLGVLIVAGGIAAAAAVWRESHVNPQTDDAEVFANLIGIAPEVNGRIVRIAVKDNQFVRKGDTLFEVDPIPYEHALQTAQSQQAVLEGQIRDLQRSVTAQESAIVSAASNSRSAQAKIASSEAAVQAAQASIDTAKAALSQATADYAYAENQVLRLEPLLTRQFVTVDVVDQARTSRSVKGEGVREARSRLAVAEAEWASAVAQQNEARAGYEQSNAQLDQSRKSVSILDPLVAQREAREATVRDAAYNLERCKVVAPFDARVTNLTISEGAYAHAGQQVFTLIDTRTWWVIANFRETELNRIKPGGRADVYVLSNPDRRVQGTIDSAGYGVMPDVNLVGGVSQGLPDVQRSLNWVHLATRFPVRIRMDSAMSEDFRMGASANVIIRGDSR